MVQITIDNFWSNVCSTPPASDADVKKIEEIIQIKLPDFYVALIQKHDGGNIYADSFFYFDVYKNCKCKGSIGLMYSLSNGEESILRDWLYPSEFFPKGLVAFADDGGGNLTCFDYRNTKENPPVVFWSCEDDEGEDVHFIANNFEEFINMLHKPED